MSFECQNWVARQEITPAARKFVLFMLANWSRADGSCWGPQDRLARFTGQSLRAVRDHLAGLEADKYIRRYERRSKRDGHRLPDGFLLDPLSEHGIQKYLDDAEALIDREAPGKPKRRDQVADQVDEEGESLPADSAGRASGRSDPPKGQDPPSLPAGSAGISIEKPHGKNIETSPAEASAEAPDGAGDPGGPSPPGATEQQEGDQAGERDRPSAYAFWKGQTRSLEDYFGGAYGTWIEGLTPVSYDGRRLVLGAYGEFARKKIAGELPDHDPASSYQAQLATLLELEVEVIVYDRAIEATRQRDAKRKAEAAVHS